MKRCDRRSNTDNERGGNGGATLRCDGGKTEATLTMRGEEMEEQH